MANRGRFHMMPLLIIIAALILLSLGIVGLVVVGRSNDYYCGTEGYGVVFDAGSSHTSMAVYQWFEETLNGTGVVSQLANIRECTEYGIASHADEPEDIAHGLNQCLDKAMEVVPAFSYADTPVYLGATAGMRMLTEVYPDKSDTIMKTVRKTLAATPFDFADEHRHARILNGDTEGTSGWISANYLAGNLGVLPDVGDADDTLTPRKSIPLMPTFGALDLGGASMQITFIPKDPSTIPESNLAHLRLYGNDYHIYTHSFSCYGADEARRRLEATLVKDSGFADVTLNPCSPIGYSYTLTGSYLWKPPCSKEEMTDEAMDTVVFRLNGTGDPAKCYNVTKTLFNFDAKCDVPPCSFNGVHSPIPVGSFKAFSGFAYTSSGIGLTSAPTIQQLNDAAQNYCRMSIDELDVLPEKMKYKVRYCFLSMYTRALLFEAFKFEESNWNIEFTLTINGAHLDWSLGYMVDATNRIPEEKACVGLSTVTFCGLLIILIIISVLGLLLLILGIKTFEGEYIPTKSAPDEAEDV